MIPIEIINKILVYVAELNNNIIITQYNTITNKEYYIINFNSDLLWRIKSTLITKLIYPIRNSEYYLKSKDFIELYKHFVPYYENELRLNTNKYK